MDKTFPLVSVVIPTHNRLKSVKRLVDGILRGDYVNVEVIVVDDASTDKTFETLKKNYTGEKRVKVLQNKHNLFTAGSRNKGARESRGEYIFFIDDDNVVTPDLISNLISVMLSDKKIGEVGPVMYYYENKNKIYWAGTRRNMSTSRTYFTTSLDKYMRDLIWDTDDVLNAFMVRASVIRKYNIYFKENLRIMYEESDFAYKIKQQGYSIKVVRHAVIYHDTADFGPEKGRLAFLYHTMKDSRRAYLTARNRIIFHKSYSSKLQFIEILLFWNWVYTGFYSLSFLFYDGPGNFNIFHRFKLCFSYIHGIFDGINYGPSK